MFGLKVDFIDLLIGFLKRVDSLYRVFKRALDELGTTMKCGYLFGDIINLIFLFVFLGVE
jgi:hypothetical protein